MNDACIQKIKIGHRANFRDKYKFFSQILFPVRAILRSINFRCTDFNTREFRQIATAGATTAAVTEKVWGEYVTSTGKSEKFTVHVNQIYTM